MLYHFPNFDAMFGANITLLPSDNTDPILAGQSIYQPNRLLTAMGCIDQYQICNPAITDPVSTNNMLCTDLTSVKQFIGEMGNIQLTLTQLQTLIPILNGISFAGMDKVADGIGSSALKAQETVKGLIQTNALPDDQWVLELASWNAISLARIQAAVLEYATGPINVVEQGGQIAKPASNDTVGQNICKRQLIFNVAGYQNFNMLGVMLILILSSVLVVLSWVLDIVVGWIQASMGRNHARLSWVEDGYLQLQRMAYEGAGHVGWKGSAENVPITRGRTREEQVLMGLDLADLRHPMLRATEHVGGFGAPEKSFGVSVLEQSDQPITMDWRR